MSSAVLAAAIGSMLSHGCTVPLLTRRMRAILATAGRWFYYMMAPAVSRSIKSLTKDHCKDFTVCWLMFTAKVLEALGLGKVVMTMHLPGEAGNYNSADAGAGPSVHMPEKAGARGSFTMPTLTC